MVLSRIVVALGTVAYVKLGRLALVLAVALLAAACGGGNDTVTSADGGITAGSVAPISNVIKGGGSVSSVSLERLDGTFGDFSAYSGKPIVVNFFSSTCAPCLKEMPDFEAVHQEMGDKVAFIGINVMDTPAKGSELKKRTGITYEVFRDPRGNMMAQFGGVAMPTTAFIDSNGNLVITQSKVFSANELRKTIEKQLL